MRRRRFELAAWEVLETAKPWREADADVAEAIDFCEYYAREMLRLAEPHRRDVPGEANDTFYEPRGVAVVIAPWNFPLAILCGMTAAALVAGNTVVMKPAEQSPVIAAKLMEVLEEAGLPAGRRQLPPRRRRGDRPDARRRTRTSRSSPSPAPAPSAWPSSGRRRRCPTARTTSSASSRSSAARTPSSSTTTPTWTRPSHGVVASAFGYAGQKCSACSRAIVLEGVYDAFLARLVEATKQPEGRPAEDPGTSVGAGDRRRGARADPRARSRRARREARLAYAADVGALADEGCYVGPHVFADVPPDASIAQEEIFGPVLAVIKAARPGRRPAHRQRHEVRPDRRPLLPQPGEHRARPARVPRRQPLHQPQDHRRPRRPPALRRLQALRHRPQGRRARLPPAVHDRPHDHRERLRHGFAPSQVTESPAQAVGE